MISSPMGLAYRQPVAAGLNNPVSNNDRRQRGDGLSKAWKTLTCLCIIADIPTVQVL